MTVKLNFPYRCTKCGQDVHAVHVVSIAGADYIIHDCEIEKLEKEPLDRFIARLEFSIKTLEKNHQIHVQSVKDTINKLKK